MSNIQAVQTMLTGPLQASGCGYLANNGGEVSIRIGEQV